MHNWYAYIYGNPLLPESYYLMSLKPERIFGSGLAAIYTKGSGEHPEGFSSEMKIHIANALGTSRSQPDNSLNPYILYKRQS
jgi:hypothetical protein